MYKNILVNKFTHKITFCRHPATFHRPTFTELYQRVCVDMSPLPQETTPSETAPHHLTVLGGSLETGKDLYPDLQNLYT